MSLAGLLANSLVNTFPSLIGQWYEDRTGQPMIKMPIIGQ
jgi:hypothetical protein